jgi:hypothetical protein
VKKTCIGNIDEELSHLEGKEVGGRIISYTYILGNQIARM